MSSRLVGARQLAVRTMSEAFARAQVLASGGQGSTPLPARKLTSAGISFVQRRTLASAGSVPNVRHCESRLFQVQVERQLATLVSDLDSDHWRVRQEFKGAPTVALGQDMTRSAAFALGNAKSTRTKAVILTVMGVSKSYVLRSRLGDEPKQPPRKLSDVLWNWLKAARPAAPNKPLSKMTEAELDRVTDI